MEPALFGDSENLMELTMKRDVKPGRIPWTKSFRGQNSRLEGMSGQKQEAERWSIRSRGKQG